MTDGWDEREVADLEDDYELLGELGRGASAVVYRARDRALGRLVAVKVVRPHSIASADDALLRLAREARTVARLQHPNIVTVHAVKRLRSGGLALIMQLVPGRTLKEAVQADGPFEPARAERVLRDVASALAYAHAHGVVHRDVKPENIFLDADTGRAMLSDFGIAHSAAEESRLTMTGAAIGTPAYMAPEQIDGAPTDARSDLYSLGLVTWEMLTGARPWEGESLFNVITKQKSETLPAIDALRPGEVPPRLQYIVERLLQKKPGARWAGADALLDKLEHWVVPSDWAQWEAAHKRRREAARSSPARAARPTPASAADLATVRFRRPTGDVPVVPADVTPERASSDGAVSVARGTPIVAAALEEQAPEWATEPAVAAPRRRGWLALVALALVAGSAAVYAERAGYFARDRAPSDAAFTVASDAPRPVIIPGALPESTDTASGTLEDSLRVSDSARVVSSAAPSMVPASGLRAEAGPGEASARDGASVPRPARRVVDSAPVADVAAPAVRATDDAGVITAGGRHSCVVTGGRALCWGANDRGQLGDGELETRDAPTPVVGELEFTQLAAGLAHTCGVTRSGEAYCWGNDERGQLGDATTTSRSAPVRVAGSFTFRVVRTGNHHTCGLTTGGEIACWGANTNGQLGDGTASMRTSPVRVASDRRFVSLSAGWNHTCAVASDGSAWCWGANADGQLGDGARADQRTPQPVVSTQRFTAIAAGGNHTCAISDAGEAWCWGRNAYGQLGTGGSASQLVPARVATTVRFTSVSAGGVHSCARTTGGQAWCWGRNMYGQLGDGSTTDRDTPVRVTGGTAYASLSATGAHTCATTTGGDVACWGFNVQGQLGDGTRNHLARPARVTVPGR